jgi:RNA polymerase sigma-70 factor (ECF subfamily)
MNIEAFQTRVLPSKNKLFRFALKFLGNEEEAKDVVQEVFIRVWNGREQMAQVTKTNPGDRRNFRFASGGIDAS